MPTPSIYYNRLNRLCSFGLTLLVQLVMAGCGHKATEGPTASAPRQDPAKVEAVLSLLKAMPDWTAMSEGNTYPQEETLALRTLRQIGAYDLDVIREAMEVYLTTEFKAGFDQGMQSLGKLTLLNTYLFALPPLVRRDSPHFGAGFGGWGPDRQMTGEPFNPQPSDARNFRWPWSVDEQGRWRLTGRRGYSTGPAYDALGTFDYYRKNFGKRDFSADK